MINAPHPIVTKGLLGLLLCTVPQPVKYFASYDPVGTDFQYDHHPLRMTGIDIELALTLQLF